MKKLELSTRNGGRAITRCWGGTYDRLTHYLFRYPAKFHPPVARALIEQFTSPGETILDPFCGSGTMLVEARVTGRNAVGTDIDPVAVFVSRTKSQLPPIAPLRHHAQLLLGRLQEMERSDAEYDRRKFVDLTEAGFKQALRRYRVVFPRIPNIGHWFRRYVIVDLGRILKAIRSGRCDANYQNVFLLTFASILRNSSNADPVPVSGLEVTSHMKRKDAEGRVINPYALYKRALSRALDAYEQFAEKSAGTETTIQVADADATDLDKYLRTNVDAVLTSPPYHNAVDYYRRGGRADILFSHGICPPCAERVMADDAATLPFTQLP